MTGRHLTEAAGANWLTPGPIGQARLDVEANQQNNDILHLIAFALQAELAKLPAFGQRATGHQVVVMDHLGTNKPTRQIGMDGPCRLQGRGPTRDGPGPRLFFASREERTESQEFVRL